MSAQPEYRFHRSPAMAAGEVRLLMTLDAM